MATSFKTLNSNTDITYTRTKLHESVPITGTIVSGTYAGAHPNEENIKNYTHGMFQSIYDYPYLSSSANHIIDLTAGWVTDSLLSGSLLVDMREQKNDIYNELSQILAGYDSTGSINRLNVSGNFSSGIVLDNMNEVFAMNFARLLTKDEIQKQADGFTLTLGVSSSYADPFGKTLTVYDKDGPNGYFTNSPAGEYNVLYATGSGFPTASPKPCGLLFYQAGVAVLTASVFLSDFVEDCEMTSGGLLPLQLLVSSSISGACDAFRHRMQNVTFNNTTELNSTIYFCRLNNGDFNFSSNPTYLSASKMRVKEVAADNPVSYITTVGLYSEDNALLSVAKLSEPIKKTPSGELILRVRNDY